MDTVAEYVDGIVRRPVNGAVRLQQGTGTGYIGSVERHFAGTVVQRSFHLAG